MLQAMYHYQNEVIQYKNLDNLVFFLRKDANYHDLITDFQKDTAFRINRIEAYCLVCKKLLRLQLPPNNSTTQRDRFMEFATQFVEKYPHHAEAYYLLGKGYLKYDNDQKSAFDVFRKAHELGYQSPINI